MRIEWLIAFYLLISVMMIAFNFCFLFYEKTRAKRFAVKTERMAQMLGDEIERNADFPTEEHKRLLERKMRTLAGMESFDQTMDHLQQLNADKSDRYLQGIASVFEHLTYHFARKSDLRRAYFAYIVKRWYRARALGGTVEQALLRYVREGSFYARQNSLDALSQVGSAHALAEAISLIEQSDDFHSPKLITEAALAFAGDADALEAEVRKRFAGLRPPTKAAVVNYLRMAGRGDRALLQGVLLDEREDLEVRLACIRYFARNFWEPAEEALLRFAAEDDPALWEYAAVAATALATYPSMRALNVLKGCLSSPSWFVRHNAAKSLYDWGLSLGDLDDVVQSPDAFARDMLRYRWELEHMQSIPQKGGAA